jgi:hypothetical protein
MVNQKEMTCQEALKKVLEGEFQRAHYSVGVYKEDAICLQKDGCNWVLYYGFRGMRDNSVSYGNVVEACLAMIRKLCRKNVEMADRLCSGFLDMVLVESIA